MTCVKDLRVIWADKHSKSAWNTLADQLLGRLKRVQINQERAMISVEGMNGTNLDQQLGDSRAGECRPQR